MCPMLCNSTIKLLDPELLNPKPAQVGFWGFRIEGLGLVQELRIRT